MVRFGVIGVGNMGRSHIKNFMANKFENGCLTAVCDIRADRLKWMDDNGYDEIKQFDEAEKLITSGLVDAVLIATPHYFHPEIAKTAFANGLSVLCEKPAGVYTKQVREMNAAAEKSDKVFGIMYNQRTNPTYRRVRELIEQGELGTLIRAVWIITKWYRPQAYHNSSDWRSTWKGEGGGALINQCPHQLDLWQWMFGMPERLRAFIGFGKHHDIEVEDDVTTYMEYKNGMSGVFITCTAETPGTNRLEIAGTRGRLIVENSRISFDRTTVDEKEFNKTNKYPFGQPEIWKCELPFDGSSGPQHIGITQNFINAIENGEKLIAPGEEGLLGLTISNSMHLSAWKDEWIYPAALNEDEFYSVLQDKIKNSKIEKKVEENIANLTW